jgi:RNA polymerase sigma factor (sigma-70 family)
MVEWTHTHRNNRRVYPMVAQGEGDIVLIAGEEINKSLMIALVQRRTGCKDRKELESLFYIVLDYVRKRTGEHLAQGDPITNIRGYFFRAFYYTVLKHLKREWKNHQTIVELDGLTEHQRDELVPLTDPMAEVDLRDALDKAIDMLTPLDRVIIRLRNQGYEYSDIASAMGMSEEALRKRISRARARLRELFNCE